MRVLLSSEARFDRTPDGSVWGPAAYGTALWARYLDVFAEVRVAARIRDVAEPSPGSVPASAAGIDFLPLPPYSGLSEFARCFGSVYLRATSAVERHSALIVRTPSPIAFLMYRVAHASKRPFGAEVMGDPYEVFSPGAFRHPLRSPIRRLAAAAQKRVTRRAAAVLYVTAQALQRAYPTRGLSFAASDAALEDDAFNEKGPRAWTAGQPFVVVTVAALDQPYKGVSFLIEAVADLRRRGVPVDLRIVGAGRLLAQLRELANTLAVAQHVTFLGAQDRTGVRQALDGSHLFVLPSLTEGLPRALLEAMARGLPAVGTTVGGVPELLRADCLVPPRNATALAARIEREIADESGRHRRGHQNRLVAQQHHDRYGVAVRREFLRQVKEVTLKGSADA
jgi:glycosyltransferase involved in cell wall biosynthesis